jgi:GxxExxY protein
LDRFDDEIESLIDGVIRCAIEVHRNLFPGYNESVYCNALEKEFLRQGIPFEREHRFVVVYKGDEVGEGRIDFWVGNRLVVEIKAAKGIDPAHVAQVVGYLAHKREQVGLLLNFGPALMKEGIRRVVRTRDL